MKKLLITLAATGFIASSAFAAAQMSEEATDALNNSLTSLGYDVQEIMVENDNFVVLASKDGQNVKLTLTEAFEILDEQPVE